MTDPQAAAQQAAAALRIEIAPRLGTYFKALVEEGFERVEALELVRDLQMVMFGDDED